MTLTLAAALLGVGLVWIACVRYRHGVVLREWATVLTPEGRNALELLVNQAQLDAAVGDHALLRAKKARERGDHQEAARILRLAYGVLEESTPSRVARLRGIALCSRMSSALFPAPPLRPRQFHLPEVSVLAAAVALVHEVVVTKLECVLLRLFLLRWGFRLSLRAMAGSLHVIESCPAGAWNRFEAALADWKALDQEHLESFRLLLLSLAAEPQSAVERFA